MCNGLAILFLISYMPSLYVPFYFFPRTYHPVSGTRHTIRAHAHADKCSCTFYSILVLFCSVLSCSVLFCSVLFCSVLSCSVLFCSVLFCSVLFCVCSSSLDPTSYYDLSYIHYFVRMLLIIPCTSGQLDSPLKVMITKSMHACMRHL